MSAVSNSMSDAPSRSRRDKTTLVLGLGNVLLSDEGVGIHALAYLRQCTMTDTRVVYVDGGTLGMGLVGMICEAERMIVLDAAELCAKPGTVRLFVGEDFDRALGKKKKSAHEVDLVDLMQASLLLGHLPQRRALVAIQPGNLDWGDQPTIAVSHAIPEAARVASELLNQWSSGSATTTGNGRMMS